MCQTRILSWQQSTVISHCIGCSMIYIWQNNLMLSFTPDEFLAFRKVISGLKFEECSIPFPDEQDRIILRTPNPDISFTFAEEEWSVFRQAIDEAHYMREVYALMQ